ncbi:hypothetical protein KAFR_0H00430 [Kazachstania africana CBS 2517]|uniref:20S-pre-rRNA D-site endonuclease NOB1 n=1 Tax=Kazachstania africana (strain ATCC 22294 / BCRC 22015 / CBS 2517 / CECT 1963 / NBRC 1671 / NRRL Y-8276) TaxID=1071382 RepID=H2AYP6_KAZAF|nr:hypothetical protein KAFR_0H00430 [Kazachstania africana CBS 2517]CCF59452.1 hypothetical protein KAFR_0H00430 [Kazachstania africana CBS 2517]
MTDTQPAVVAPAIINKKAHLNALVLDATPLITQSYTHYQNYAQSFYTTPTVFHEIKDVNARKNLEIWQSLGTLKLVHPSAESIQRVSNFAKLTGDYSVLSANDIHILALTYQLECDLNNGDWRLRKKPGDILQKQTETTSVDAGKKKKNRRRGGKKQRAKREAQLVEEASNEEPKLMEEASNQEPQIEGNAAEEVTEKDEIPEMEETSDKTELLEEYLEEDDDGEWITPDTLTETMIKDSGEDTTGSRNAELSEKELSQALNNPKNQVALATGDFAAQNVALQLNLNLMNFMSGLRIKRLRNYMLRCHACFKLYPLPKDGRSKHFCPSCGGQGTLLRCAVSVDSETGKITPHLKANFKWNNRGNRYSLSSPLSKNSQKKYGKKGYVHSKPQESAILREDQKEYEKAQKQEEWTRRHNEKVLDNWIGGGSAENYISPFAVTGLKHHSVRVGRGRYVNSTRRKK